MSAIPAPGQAPLPAPNAAALLRTNGTDPDRRDRPAIHTPDHTWTHGDYLAESCRWANLFLELRPTSGPFHVAVLMDNIPEYLFALGGAALTGATIVGLNSTRRGANLLRDISHTDCGILIGQPHLIDELIAPIESEIRTQVLTTDAIPQTSTTDPGLEPDVDTRLALIFTSGTSDAPKAVICSQRRILVTGNRMRMILDLGPDDVGYVCMPLFHSSSMMVGWGPSLVAGASIGLAQKFSASGWLRDVRRYGTTWWNYTGKPLSYLLATPEQPDDHDNPVRVAFGNEGSPQVIDAFSRRFGITVIDAFGATEGGIAVNRVDDGPTGAMGLVTPNVKVVDEDGHERPRARFDDTGRLANADEAVGEIVNTAGAGPFEGYYNNDEANERATRNGWYWSGDLGYVDDAGYLFFAGRNADWIRVDGENFPAGPIEAAISRYPPVLFCAAYGVPDEQAGDQVMTTLQLREGQSFDPDDFAKWLDGQPDLGPKWRPRYVRVTAAMPTTATGKIVKRTLVQQKYRADRTNGDPMWWRPRGESTYRPFTDTEEKTVHDGLVAAGRERFWDL
jgi:fatty-acyl-CoA synthase